MLIAHLFADRDIPTVTVDTTREDSLLNLQAIVETGTRVTAVRVWHASDSRGAYLNGTQWTQTDLQPTGARFRGSFPAPANTYVVYFVEVEDLDSSGLPGVVTTGFQEAPPTTKR